MKKYLLIIPALALLLIGGLVFANTSSFSGSFYLTGSSSTTSPATVGVNGSAQSFVADSYANGSNTKFDESYLLTQLTAATISSTTPVSVGITISYSMDGVDYFVDNTATSTTANPIVLGGTPQYTFSANVTSSSTLRSAIKVPVPTRYIKVTYTGLTATSSVWAQLVPIKENSN